MSFLYFSVLIPATRVFKSDNPPPPPTLLSPEPLVLAYLQGVISENVRHLFWLNSRIPKSLFSVSTPIALGLLSSLMALSPMAVALFCVKY